MTNYKISSSTPLGLFSFSLTTITLMFLESEILDYDLIGQISSLALFYGGLVQLICAIFEIYYNNSFTATVFGSYSAFWLSFAYLNYMEQEEIYLELNKQSHLIYLISWGVITTMFSLLTYYKNNLLKGALISLQLAFYLLGIGAYSNTIKIIGSSFGFLAGGLAGYLGFCELFYETYDYKLLGFR